MNDEGLGSFWALIVPDFGAIGSGTVDAATPILVMIIWAVGIGACAYAVRQAHQAISAVAEARSLIDGVSGERLAKERNAVLAASESRTREVRDAWREFDETLVADNGRLFNTVNAEEFFNEHRFAPRLVDNRFLHAMPTALTTLGLLGTFLGLTVGLRELDLGSTTDQLRVGIQTLVSGAALGFTASLWGVAMSLVTNVIERWQERRVVRAVRGLQASIDQLFPMRSPEQSLSEIATHTGESREALQILHEKIGSALQQTVEHIGADTSRAVTEAIQGSLAPVMAELAKTAANQSADVFNAVSEKLTASFSEMGTSLAEELKASSESMRSTLDYMGERLAQQADQHLSQMNELRATAVAQLGAVNEATERQIRLLDESLPRVVNGLDRAASLVGTAFTGMEEVTSGLSQVTSDLRDTSTSLTRMLAEAIASMEQMASTTSTAATALASQQSSITDLTENARAAAELLTTASGVLSGGFDGMRVAQERFLTDLRHQLDQHAKDMAGWFASYGNEVSKQTGARMDEWNAQTERFTSTMLQATQALSDAVDELSVPRPGEPAAAAG